MRRAIRIGAWVVAAIVLLVIGAGGAVWVAGNTESGQRLIERVTSRLTSGHVTLSDLGGSFPTQLTLAELRLSDSHGVWLDAQRIELRWSPLKLLERRIQVDTVHAARVHMERTPISDTPGGKATTPHVEVGDFSVDVVELGAPLVGTPARLSLLGKMKLRSLEDADANVVAHRLDGDGDYALQLKLDARHLDALLALREPAGGPLENLLSLPGLGALSGTLNVHGPRAAERVDLKLTAGDLKADVHGTVDLAHRGADLEYSLTAPAMAPRPDLSWSAASLSGTWHGPLSAAVAEGKLDIEALALPGNTRLGHLDATLAAQGGSLSIKGFVDGLVIPGPAPRLLAGDRLAVQATVALNTPGRPVELTASHVLFNLRARADSTTLKSARQRATVELDWRDLTPLAAMAGQNINGDATLKGQVEHTSNAITVGLDGNANLTGGGAGWLPWVGPRVAAKLDAVLTDDAVKVQTVRITARAGTLSANGSASLSPAAPTPAAAGRTVKDVKGRWQLEVPDLAAVSVDLKGDLKASGQIAGPPESLKAEAQLTSRLSVRDSPEGTIDATLHAEGLPHLTDAALQAHGMLDGAPLAIDAAVRRAKQTYVVEVRRAEWKSARAQGQLTADTALTDSHGELQLHVAQLGDFDRLLGVALGGSLEGTAHFLPTQGRTQAQLVLDAKALTFRQFSGDAHLEAAGATDAVDLKLAAQLPALYGAPAVIAATGALNLDAHQLHLATLSLVYRNETFRVLSPAVVSFSQGVSVDDLKLGARDAVLEVRGQFAPLIDMRGSLSHVTPDLVNAFWPGLLASGSFDAQTKLRGSPADLAGGIRFDAVGIRFADEAATGLPAVDLHGRAQLANSLVNIKGALTAGSGSQLTLSGTAPLQSDGTLDLKLDGRVDAGLANPFLEARGLHAAGQLSVAIGIAGTAASPALSGGMTLNKGSVRDYGRGVNLSEIEAVVVGDNGGLLIKKFTATAVSGNIEVAGRIGILEPGVPLNVKITASNAQPVASSLVTANLDADIAVTGNLRDRLDASGKIHVNRAIIGIPNSLPPDVAVLDVRRRGKTVMAAGVKPLVIGIDLAIIAPQEVLVQGRGLDAELGGEVRLTGTTEDLVASGGFNLQRGRFTLGGSKLEFTSDSRVGFDGSGLRRKIDPTLDFTANSTVGDTTATLRITGQADAPRFDFSSSPSLPQDEIMALLLFGKPAQQLTAFELAQIGAALATLSGVGGNGLNPLAKIQKTLGLDRLTVGSNTTTTATGGTENQGAAIAAGRYVSKRIYIEGKQTTTGTSQVQVDVDLTKHLKLQTRLGNGTAATQGTTPENDPGSSVGLSYQFEY